MALAPVRVAAADTFRAFAMLLVMTLHCVLIIPQWSKRPPEAPAVFLGGELAVPFFFVLSGFVLSLGATREGSLGSLREYFERRAVRILPAYWLMLLVLLLAWPFLFEKPSPLTTREGVLAALAHVPMLQFALLGPTEHGFIDTYGFGVNPIVWSLTNEVVFYGVFPFVVAAFLRRPRAALALSLVTSVVWRAGATHLVWLGGLAGVDVPSWLPEHLFKQAPGFAFAFGVGMFAASVHAAKKGHPFFATRRGLTLQAASAAIVLAGLHLAGTGWTPPVYHRYLRDLVPAAAFAAWLTFACNSPPSLKAAYEVSAGRLLGHLSYGAFLWHVVVLHVVLRLFSPQELGMTQGTWALVALVFPPSLLVGWLSFRFVEQPLLRFLAWRHRERRKRAGRLQEAPLVRTPAPG